MATADVCKSAPFSYLWIIENVSELTYINVKSTEFVENSISKKALYLQIQENAEFRCYLRSENDFLEAEPCEIDIEISLLATDGSTLISKRNDESELFVTLLTRDAFLERKAEFISNNTLTVRCRMWRRVSEIATGFCYARTKLETYRRSIVWGKQEFSALHSSAVEDFSALHSNTVEGSSELALDGIKVYRLGPLTTGGPFLALILYLERNSVSEDVYVDVLIKSGRDYTFNCEISVLDVNGEVIDSKVEGGLKSKIFKFRPLISKSKLMADKNLFLPNDTLILKCSFEICFPNIFSEDFEYYTPNVSSVLSFYGAMFRFPEDVTDENTIEEQFSNEEDDNDNAENIIQEQFSNEDKNDDDYDFYDDYDDDHFYSSMKERITDSCEVSCPFKSALRYLHNDTTMSDINLRVGTKLYPAHKNILCSRSPVFKKMLGDDMAKKTIEIADMNENTFCRLYKYIYTDAVEDIEFEEALDLYKAAGDYQLLVLKCSDILGNNLRKDNVCDLLSLSKKYQDKELEKRAQEMHAFYKRLDALRKGPDYDLSNMMNAMSFDE